MFVGVLLCFLIAKCLECTWYLEWGKVECMIHTRTTNENGMNETMVRVVMVWVCMVTMKSQWWTLFTSLFPLFQHVCPLIGFSSISNGFSSILHAYCLKLVLFIILNPNPILHTPPGCNLVCFRMPVVKFPENPVTSLHSAFHPQGHASGDQPCPGNIACTKVFQVKAFEQNLQCQFWKRLSLGRLTAESERRWSRRSQSLEEISISLSSAIRSPYRGGASPTQQKKTHPAKGKHKLKLGHQLAYPPVWDGGNFKN